MSHVETDKQKQEIKTAINTLIHHDVKVLPYTGDSANSDAAYGRHNNRIGWGDKHELRPGQWVCVVSDSTIDLAMIERESDPLDWPSSLELGKSRQDWHYWLARFHVSIFDVPEEHIAVLRGDADRIKKMSTLFELLLRELG